MTDIAHGMASIQEQLKRLDARMAAVEDHLGIKLVEPDEDARPLTDEEREEARREAEEWRQELRAREGLDPNNLPEWATSMAQASAAAGIDAAMPGVVMDHQAGKLLPGGRPKR